MSQVLCLWLVPSGLAVGLLGASATLLSRAPVILALSRWTAHGWALVLAVTWALRTREAGHLPLFGSFESALSLSLATVLAAVVWEHIGRRRVLVTPFAVLVATALIGHGGSFDPTVYALTISERSWVVDVHAVLAWSAFAVLAVNACLALSLLLDRDRRAIELDRWLVLSLELGFVLHTAMLASGSVYKFLLFGSAWSFDPVETLGIVVWMSCGALLHMHRFAGWSGRRLARWCLGLFVLLVVSYRAIVYFPPWSTYHIFDMDRRLHVGAEQLGIGGEGAGGDVAEGTEEVGGR